MNKYFSIGLLLFVSLSAYSQTIVKRYICTDAISSELRNDDLQAEESANICNSGTQVYAIVQSGNSLISGTPVVTREGGGPHPVVVDVNWNAGQTGIAVIEVRYRKRIKQGFKGCKWSDRYLYTYELHREFVNPSGTYSGTPVAYVSANQTAATFNLNYFPLPNLPTEFVVKKIRYLNGVDADKKEVDVTKVFPNSTAYNPTPVVFHTSGMGQFFLKSEVYFETAGQCGTWLPVPDKEVNVYSNCYMDDFSQVEIGLTGLTRIPEEQAPAFKTSMNQSYTLEVSGIGDFAGNYIWNFSDFGGDITINGNSFTPLKKGSYRVTVNSLEEGCPTPQEVLVLVDGENLYIEQPCSISLPADISQFYPEITTEDIVLRHFTAYVKSERSITIQPGVTLEQGAELILDLPEPQPGDEGTADLKMNFTELVSFDEYGNVLGQNRSYFDHKGTPLQIQYKNLSSNVVMANATIYDALGRAAISTLSAPVRAAAAVECPIEDKPGTPVNFIYKPDFVKATPAKIYDYSHFDLAKENAPDAIDASEEGTLGWYYSSNNGTSTNPNMNEPLVATTQYPYSRTLFYNDGTGDVKGVTKPGDVFKGGSYMATSLKEAVAVSDSYFSTDYKSYLSIRQNELGLARPSSIEGQFFKTTTMDGSGKKSVTYTDKSGQTIIALYFGSGTTPITKSYQFYDLAGRLLVSISPNGLNQYTGSNFDQIDKTRNFYNGRGQLVAVEEKIAGGGAVNGISRSEFVYRKDGKIRFSQNAEQRKAASPRYSYTNYDVAGRAIESGEYITDASSIVFNSAEMKAILESTSADGGLLENIGTKTERSFSIYDEVQGNVPLGRSQRFVHGAVSSSRKDDQVTSWYSYDERGRVEWMIQDIKDLGIKTVDYRYGPTGQVQDVIYQAGIVGEQFIHHYEYDADGRLKKVYTTRELLVYNDRGRLTNAGISYVTDDGFEIDNPGILELQATYSYYLHGPLKRIELANKLQGIDYVYTADGALKSINHSEPDDVNTPGVTKDPGKDGDTNGFKKDVFGMSLDYYGNDYVAANGTTNKASMNGSDQYTGLIKAMRWHSPIETNKQFAYVYQYDQRNQFTKADWGTVTAGVVVPHPLKPEQYQEEIPSYDANGNIEALRRNASANLLASDNANINIADFAYHYKPNTNMLDRITQEGDDNNVFRSYLYDDLGQMIQENEGDKSKYIKYDVTGKVQVVYADEAGTLPITTFTYDDKGFRLKKVSSYEDEDGEEQTLTTWYVRDATGNIMTTYEHDSSPGEILKPVEMPVYASGRIGMYKPDYGITFYELNDHLGNVRAVIGDELETTYMATMEAERDAQEVDVDGFINRTPSATAEYINHTAADIVVDKQSYHFETPNKVNRINNRPNGELHPDPIGTGILVWVHPGDEINAEVFAKYTNFDANNTNVLAAVAGFLTTSFTSAPVVDGASIFNVMNTPGFSALPAWANLDDNQPRAFLSYLLFDNNNKLLDYQFDQVSDAAEIPQTDPFAHPHERLALENIKIEKEGYMYIYVSNQSDQNMEVYFDDLTVKQKFSNIVAGGDYYPFGLAIKDRQIERDKYRNGYQGQFSEKDDETGWNHFELREFDPIIGRWLSTDPEKQYYSPYVGMGNNPLNGLDIDGALFDPVYGSNGEHRGNTTEGFIRKEGSTSVIIYDGKEDFSKMTADQLLSNGGALYDNTQLSGFAKSSILTNMLTHIPGFDASLLHNGMISIGNVAYSGIDYNDPVGGSMYWSTDRDDKGKYIISQWTGRASPFETTVENIWSIAYDHEYSIHGVGKTPHWKDLTAAYDNQFKNKEIWDKTTNRFKNSIMQSLKGEFDKIRKPFPSHYVPMYEKFVKTNK